MNPSTIPAAEPDTTPDLTPADAERDHRDRLADELVRIADDIRTRRLPVDSPVLYLGVLDSRADLEQWAAYLGSEIVETGGVDRNIPKTQHKIPLDDNRWGLSLQIHAQIQPDGQSEVERLRAEVAALRAAQAVTR